MILTTAMIVAELRILLEDDGVDPALVEDLSKGSDIDSQNREGECEGDLATQ